MLLNHQIQLYMFIVLALVGKMYSTTNVRYFYFILFSFHLILAVCYVLFLLFIDVQLWALAAGGRTLLFAGKAFFKNQYWVIEMLKVVRGYSFCTSRICRESPSIISKILSNTEFSLMFTLTAQMDLVFTRSQSEIW